MFCTGFLQIFVNFDMKWFISSKLQINFTIIDIFIYIEKIRVTTRGVWAFL